MMEARVDPTICKRAVRPGPHETLLQNMGLAMCNAERKFNMLSEVLRWVDLTDEAQEHYRRLAEAAFSVIND